MSETKPMRPWFRFHLLTLVLMMFVAGGLMWMNTPRHFQEPTGRGDAYNYRVASGWPWSFKIEGARIVPNSAVQNSYHHYYPSWVMADVVVCVVLTLVVGMFYECAARRRDQQAMSNPKRPWFRFHLQTLMLMALTVGVLTWANTIRVTDEVINGNTASERLDAYGFPIVWYTRERNKWGDGWSQIMNGEFHYSLNNLIENLISNLAILAILVLLAELLLRRRKARKP